MFKFFIRYLFITVFVALAGITVIAIKPEWRDPCVQYILEQQLSTDDYQFRCENLNTNFTHKGISLNIDAPKLYVLAANSKVAAPNIIVDIKLRKWRLLEANITISQTQLDNSREQFSFNNLNLLFSTHLFKLYKNYTVKIQGIKSSIDHLHNINSITAQFSNHKLRPRYQLKQARVSFANGGHLQLNGNLILGNSMPSELNLEGEVQNTLIDYWRIAEAFYNTENIAPTWEFLDSFIKKGTIETGKFNLNLTERNFKQPSTISKENLDAEFLLRDITLDYGTEFPQVKNITSVLKLIGPKLSFDILRATSANTSLKEGTVILDLTDKKPFVDVTTYSTGPVRDLIDFIPANTLDELKQANLDLNNIEGKATTNNHLIIPLDEEAIIFDITSKAQEVMLEPNQYVEFSHGTLDAHYTGSNLDITGKGDINGYESKLTYAGELNDTDPSHKLDMSFVLTTLPNPDDIIRITEGSADGQLSVYKNKNQTKIRADINLDNAAYKIPIFGITTDLETKSQAVLSTEFVRGSYIPVQIDITSNKGLVLDLDIDFIDSSWLFNIKKAYDYHIDFDGQIKVNDQIIKADIQGNLLDISDINFAHLLKQDSKQPPADSEKVTTASATEESKKRNIDLNFKLRQIKMKNNIWFDNVRVDIECDQNICPTGFINAMVGSKELSIIREENTPGIEEWRIFSDNAGAVLQAFGVYDHLRAGNLLLVTKRKYNSPDKAIEGNFVISEFITTDTPFVTRIISFISLPGLMSTIVNNKNISFKEMQGRFNFVNDTINISHIGAEGPYFDFTIKGKINTLEHNYKLKGTVSPSLYGISTIVRHIPLIGAIFSGGNRKGLFVAPFVLNDSY